jgi:hypothetical protein
VVNLKKQGPLDGYEIPYFMRKFYDELYGISEKCYVIKEGKYELKLFEEFNNPLKMVSKTVTEGLMESDVYRRRAWEYRTYNIATIQGMDFKDWMQQTPAQLEGILNDIRREKELAMSNPPPNIDQMTPEEQAMYYREALIRGSKAF